VSHGSRLGFSRLKFQENWRQESVRGKAEQKRPGQRSKVAPKSIRSIASCVEWFPGRRRKDKTKNSAQKFKKEHILRICTFLSRTWCQGRRRKHEGKKGRYEEGKNLLKRLGGINSDS